MFILYFCYFVDKQIYPTLFFKFRDQKFSDQKIFFEIVIMLTHNNYSHEKGAFGFESILYFSPYLKKYIIRIYAT